MGIWHGEYEIDYAYYLYGLPFKIEHWETIVNKSMPLTKILQMKNHDRRNAALRTVEIRVRSQSLNFIDDKWNCSHLKK